jgi:dolichyl-phosphate-mannose-protein mannosyltransferase
MKPRKKPNPQAIAAANQAASISRRELALLTAIATVGFVLRALAFARSAVEHFDEGVYSSNIYFPPPELTYPLQRFYAPPLLPALIELGMIVGLPPNIAALLPSFLAGCGTVVALWWFGRSWFGPRVGVAVAALVALSPFHITFSVAALTDVLLGLFVVLAVDAAARSLCGDLRWAVVAGIYTGLAWWTKYNGWLPLAIEAAAIAVLWLLRDRGQGHRTSASPLIYFLVTAAVAAAIWSPYLLALQDQGGYTPIAANHAKYAVGLGGWYGSARRQSANFFLIDGGWSGAALVAALALAAVVPAMAVEPCSASRQRQKIGAALVSVWWLGLAITTPLYWPYPRLLLPGLLATWLGAAILIDLLLRQRRERLAAGLISLLAIAPTITGLGWSWASRANTIGNDRRALLKIAREIRRDLDQATFAPAAAISPPSRAVYVFGEPAIFFQLRAGGEPIVVPAQHVIIQPATIGDEPAPTFLVTGPHAQRDPQFADEWAAEGSRWALVTEYAYTPSFLVWLDLHDPRHIPGNGPDSIHAIRLYQLRPKPPAKADQ